MDDPPAHARTPMTVLLVDDDPSTLVMCRKALEQDGFIILQAAGSSEALKLQADHHGPIDLVVTDIMLPPPSFQLSIPDNPFPRVNGPELVDLLLDATRELRFLYISGNDRADLLARGVVLADVPFLKKPFTGEALRALVREILARPPTVKQAKKHNPASPTQVDWFG